MVRRWLGFGAPVGLLGMVGVMAALAGPGCTVTVSDGPLDGGDFDGDIDANLPQDNPCNACLFQQCSGSWAVCQNQSECFAIYSCAVTCSGDQTCINSCFCNHPAGQNAYVSLAACDSYYSCGTCTTQCATPATSCTAPGVIVRDVCGTAPPPDDAGTVDATPPPDDASPPPPDDAGLPPTDAAVVQDCTGCIGGKCSAEKSACGSGSECELYTLCVSGCQDSGCVGLCGEAHPTGLTASQALEQCTATNCKDACGL